MNAKYHAALGAARLRDRKGRLALNAEGHAELKGIRRRGEGRLYGGRITAIGGLNLLRQCGRQWLLPKLARLADRARHVLRPLSEAAPMGILTNGTFRD